MNRNIKEMKLVLLTTFLFFQVLAFGGAYVVEHEEQSGRPISPSVSNAQYLAQCAEDAKNSKNGKKVIPTVEHEKGKQLFLQVKAILGSNEHKCATCHTEGSKEGSKQFTNILNPNELISKGMVNTEKPELSKLHQELKDDSMPLNGTPLTVVEKAKILEWIKDGAPNENGIKAGDLAVGFISEDDKMLCITKDLQTIPKEDQKHIRYLSLTHLYNAGKSTEDVQVALTRLLNSLSWKENLVLPKKVDGLGTLLRIDLRDLGWNPQTWNQILQKNPYGVELKTETAKNIYTKTETITPDVRGDWFVFSASKPPLYHDILNLPGGDKQPGADKQFANLLRVENNLKHHEKEHFSVGVRQSGVSINNRIYHRSPTVDKTNNDINDDKRVTGYLYSSDDFASSDDKQSIFAHPGDYVKNGGEFIGSIPKVNARGEKMNAQVYLLANDRGVRLDDVDTNLGIVSHPKRFRNGFRVANGVSCFDCHERLGSGIITTQNPLGDHLRTNYDLFKNSNVPLSILNQYKTDDEVKPIFSKDQELYKKFMDETGGKPGIVFDIATEFEDDMTEKQVASELGLTVEDFREKVKKDASLTAKLGFNAAGVISRKTFLKEFKDVVGSLAMGGVAIQNTPADISHKPAPSTAQKPALSIVPFKDDNARPAIIEKKNYYDYPTVVRQREEEDRLQAIYRQQQYEQEQARIRQQQYEQQQAIYRQQQYEQEQARIRAQQEAARRQQTYTTPSYGSTSTDWRSRYAEQQNRANDLLRRTESLVPWRNK